MRLDSAKVGRGWIQIGFHTKKAKRVKKVEGQGYGGFTPQKDGLHTKFWTQIHFCIKQHIIEVGGAFLI